MGSFDGGFPLRCDLHVESTIGMSSTSKDIAPFLAASWLRPESFRPTEAVSNVSQLLISSSSDFDFAFKRSLVW